MLFNSFSFVVFFVLVFIVFYSLPSRFRNLLLFIASYFFYIQWKPEYGLLLAFSTIISYYTAIIISHKTFEERKKYIFISVFINLSILFFFKYFNFFNDNFRNLFSHFNLNYPIPNIVKILLPVGISFYTFETISYVLDIYYERRDPEKKFFTYALYISFFPKLLAGPIEKSTNLLVQLNSETKFNYERVVEGLRRMLWGFFKKIVIADRLSSLIDPVYSHPSNFSGMYVLIICYLFAFQIYCDFSGYTDIAIGASKILGYDIVENFNFPFLSKNVGEFWRRWHLSLSNWLKDYLFTPIVFKRKGWNNYALVYATFITFILCGLWHGAKWTFVVFGLLQGIVISYELLTKNIRKKWASKMPSTLYDNLSLILTFHFIVFSFIFFRADNMHNAFEIINKTSGLFKIYTFRSVFPAAFHKYDFIICIFSIITMEYIHFLQRKGVNWKTLTIKPVYVRWTFYYLIIIAIITLGVFEKNQFIYYQF